MATTITSKTDHEHGGVNPILLVAGVVAVAVVAFVVAVVAFGGGAKTSSQNVTAGGQTGDTSAQGCGDAKPDSAYSVTMTSDPNPPRVEGTTFHLSVRRDGKALTGAKVCMSADMTEMHHEGLNQEAKEASGGTYDTTLKFGMRGPYEASVVITEPGKAAVSVPLSFQVD